MIAIGEILPREKHTCGGDLLVVDHIPYHINAYIMEFKCLLCDEVLDEYDYEDIIRTKDKEWENFMCALCGNKPTVYEDLCHNCAINNQKYIEEIILPEYEKTLLMVLNYWHDVPYGDGVSWMDLREQVKELTKIVKPDLFKELWDE